MHLDIQTHRLACGIPLMMLENHDVAVATADVWVHTGGADEPDDLSGISHFLEHMLFKGTERWGVGEIEREIEAVGGICNAGTSYDFTHYYVTLPSFAIERGVEMLAGMMCESTIDAVELDKERQVILEEYRRKQDSPVGLLYERLYTEMFETGRYHRPVIGTEETIRTIDRPRMLDYYRRRYAPASQALVVTGHFDPAQIIAAAEKAFADYDRPFENFHQPEPTRYARAKQIRIDKHTGGEIYVAFAFPAPGYNQPDRVLPLDLLQCLIGQGRGALLYQSLKENQGLCSSIGVSYPTHETDSLIAITATCKPEQVAPLREALLREIAGVAATPPTEGELRRARRLLSSAHRFSLETTGSLSSQIGYAFTVSGSLDHLLRYFELLDAVTPEQLIETAADCFRPDAMVEVSVGPSTNGNGRS